MAAMYVMDRMLTEYRELPGLRLTTRQAARLWALEPVECEHLLNALVTLGHLYLDERGRYAAALHTAGARAKVRPPRSAVA